MIGNLKTLIEKFPYCVGRLLARVPFSWRLGNKYGQMQEECRCVGEREATKKEQYAIEHFRKVFDYAREVFPC